MDTTASLDSLVRGGSRKVENSEEVCMAHRHIVQAQMKTEAGDALYTPWAYRYRAFHWAWRGVHCLKDHS